MRAALPLLVLLALPAAAREASLAPPNPEDAGGTVDDAARAQAAGAAAMPVERPRSAAPALLLALVATAALALFPKRE